MYTRIIQLQSDLLKMGSGHLGKEKLKCIMVYSGTESVVMVGILMMLMLFVVNLAILEQLQQNTQELHMDNMLLLF